MTGAPEISRYGQPHATWIMDHGVWMTRLNAGTQPVHPLRLRGCNDAYSGLKPWVWDMRATT